MTRKIYVTRQGEMVDQVAQVVFGRTAGVTEAILAANPGLSALGAVLPMGTEILLPEIDRRATARPQVSLWD